MTWPIPRKKDLLASLRTGGDALVRSVFQLGISSADSAIHEVVDLDLQLRLMIALTFERVVVIHEARVALRALRFGSVNQ